ncbi:MAG: two-component regulator propeller domain-containing protein [Bacteroidales bacterium]
MLRKLNIVILVLFLPSVMPLMAQLDPNKITQYDELKGTPIFDILPDSRGNIWIGTQSGLVRFDGYEYKRYHPDLNDSTTMGELLTYVLHEDDQGYIWIGSQEAVYRYNPEYESFTRFPFGAFIDNEGMFQTFVANITDNHRGRVYFGIASSYNTPGSHTVFYYDLKENQMMRYESGDSLRSTFFSCTGPDGNIWLIDWSGFYKIDTLNMLHRVTMPEDAMNQIDEPVYATGLAIDSSGVLWTTTNMSGLYSFNPHSNEFTNWEPEIPFEGEVFNSYTQMHFDGEQHLWIASQQGLMQFDPGTRKIEVFEPGSTDRLLRDRYSAVVGDRFGNLWIGTESMGLLMYNPRNLLNSFKWDENDPSTITTGWTVRMLESKTGELWVATRGSGVNTGINCIDLDHHKVKPYLYADIDPSISWYNIPGEIYTGTLLIESSFRQFGLLNLHTLQFRDTVIEQISDSVSLNTIYTDTRENLWFCKLQWAVYATPRQGRKAPFRPVGITRVCVQFQHRNQRI